MTIEINGAVPVFDNKQRLVVYQQFNAPEYPEILGVLAPNTNDELYYSGTLMCRYTTANAPVDALAGTFVNYDPESEDEAQTVATHVIASQWVNGVVGMDPTSQTTRTATFNQYSFAPLLTGTTLYYATLTEVNSTEVMDGFNAQFIVSEIVNIQLNQADCPLITIQGVQA